MYCDCPTLGRCCFCMPLRRGVIGFGYLNLFFCAFMVGVHSYSVHVYGGSVQIVYHGTVTGLPVELCLFLYIVEVLFGVILLYGAHKRSALYLKAFYYFAITTVVAAILMLILELIAPFIPAMRYLTIQMVVASFCGICVQLYLIVLVRSLLRRLEIEANPSTYDNQLNQIVMGEPRANGGVESNGVYNNTTAPASNNGPRRNL